MLSATEPMLKFEYAAQNLEDTKITKTDGHLDVENYEIVRFIYNLYTHFKL